MYGAPYGMTLYAALCHMAYQCMAHCAVWHVNVWRTVPYGMSLYGAIRHVTVWRTVPYGTTVTRVTLALILCVEYRRSRCARDVADLT